ncbi:MAG: hypothetical protein E6767_16615 [Dysgonomonas sp.]|nr:hypothetical protein [Dysgonomonas sp.]
MTGSLNSLRIQRVAIFVFVFILFLILYSLVFRMWDQDFNAHCIFALEMVQGQKAWSGNFLFYWLIGLFSFFGTDISIYKMSLVILLALASTVRFGWSQFQIEKIGLFPSNKGKSIFYTAIIGLSLLFIFAIPVATYLEYGKYYIGNFVPNVWHNSSIIMLFPFAVILFYESFKQIEQFQTKRNLIILALIIVSVFIKPSFFFVFGAVYPLFLLIRYKFSKEFWYSIIPVFLGGVCVLLQYYIIYISAESSGSDSSVIIAPFLAYTEYTELKYLPFTLLCSFLFPIVYFIMNYKKMIKNRLWWYVIVSLFVAMSIYFTLAETGERAAHGNFFWQIVICVWLLFFQSLIFLLKDIKAEGMNKKNIWLVSLYALHVIAGGGYLLNMCITGVYY